MSKFFYQFLQYSYCISYVFLMYFYVNLMCTYVPMWFKPVFVFTFVHYY